MRKNNPFIEHYTTLELLHEATTKKGKLMNLLDCDWCQEFFDFNELFNVNYNDGYANVLCENCVDEAQKDCADRIESVWK